MRRRTSSSTTTRTTTSSIFLRRSCRIFYTRHCCSGSPKRKSAKTKFLPTPSFGIVRLSGLTYIGSRDFRGEIRKPGDDFNPSIECPFHLFFKAHDNDYTFYELNLGSCCLKIEKYKYGTNFYRTHFGKLLGRAAIKFVYKEGELVPDKSVCYFDARDNDIPEFGSLTMPEVPETSEIEALSDFFDECVQALYNAAVPEKEQRKRLAKRVSAS